MRIYIEPTVVLHVRSCKMQDYIEKLLVMR